MSTTLAARYGFRSFLMNEELSAPGLELMVPDISKPCVMFFPWTSASIRKAPSGSLDGDRYGDLALHKIRIG